MVFWPGLGDLFVCQRPIGVYVYNFLRQVLGCAYSICWYGQISISCTSPSDHLARPVVSSLIFLECIICCIRLLCDRWFRLYSHKTYICCVSSVLALIWLVLMALFCTAIRRDSVSLLKFIFLSHVQIFSCEMLFISRLKHP